MKRIMITAALALAACTSEVTGPDANELALARDAQQIAEQEISTTQHHYQGWLARLLRELRTTTDPEAQAFLAQARQYHAEAAAARAAGDFAEARRLHQLAFRSVLSAVLELHPDAPARAGELVDNVVARIEARLGDREAPRIRRILAHVKDLRAQAQAAADAVDELALNLRAVQILHRLVHHVRVVRDGERDAVADEDLHATAI